MTANRLLGEGGELIRFCQPVAIVLRRRTAWHITVKHCCQWRIKRTEDEYSTKDNRST